MKQSQRRSAAASWITNQRVADYNLRAALTRSVAVGAALGAVVAAAASGSPVAAWVWAVFALAVVGMYFAAVTAYFISRDSIPREPVTRWALEQSMRSQGKFQVNLASVVEAAAGLGLAVVGPWGIAASGSTVARLVAVGGATVFAASFASAVMVDTAWYTEDDPSDLLFELTRAATGPLVAVILGGLILPGPWTTDARLIAALCCGSALLVQVRIRETDRAVNLAAIWGGDQGLAGRRFITDALHASLVPEIATLKRYAQLRRQSDRELSDLVSQVDGSYREILVLGESAVTSEEWPGALQGVLERLRGRFGVAINFDTDLVTIGTADRRIARLVLEGLTVNALEKNAATVNVALTLSSDYYVATVADDAAAFLPGTWMRAGGGLARLADTLSTRGGTIELSTGDGSVKAVTAKWRAER